MKSKVSIDIIILNVRFTLNHFSEETIMVPDECMDGACCSDGICASPVTWLETKEIANRLALFPQVSEVWVFGNSSLCPPAEEASLILLVKNEDIYKYFVSETNRRIEEDPEGIRMETLHRKLVIASILGDEAFQNFQDGLDTDMDHAEISLLLNLFILPINWRHRLAEIQNDLCQFESNFMFRVSQSARILVRHVK